MFFFFLDPAEIARLETIQFPHLDAAQRFVEHVRSVDPLMSVATLASFLKVAGSMSRLAKGEASLRDLAQELGFAPTSLARHLDLLAEGGPNLRGLNLIEKGVHPSNKRLRQIRLTAKGMCLLRNLSDIIGCNVDPNHRKSQTGAVE